MHKTSNKLPLAVLAVVTSVLLVIALTGFTGHQQAFADPTYKPMDSGFGGYTNGQWHCNWQYDSNGYRECV
ncbi:MAG: hypothetical protein WA667_20050 [Candidatus Nitrosopolaris sp.]